MPSNTQPLVFVIFGATGDLMSRKLMPALFSLFVRSKDTWTFHLVCVGRRDVSQDDYRSMMQETVKKIPEYTDEHWQVFAQHIQYIAGFFAEAELYSNITSSLKTIDDTVQACVPRFFYLATPPDHYEMILTHLKDSELSKGCGQDSPKYTKILIEKPFGRDTATAQHLDTLLASIFDERQIYRIDHYLAKETVQNILAFRFANGMLEPTWNHRFIDHVQLTVFEEYGVGSRGVTYDGVGALRDVVQNHLIQTLSLIAMEQPKAFDAAAVRDARTQVVRHIFPIESHEVDTLAVRGQYEGYRNEPGVAPLSTTETFAAVKVMIDRPRWHGVPFYLRTGKRLSHSVAEISLHYKKPALCFEDVCLFDPNAVQNNVLTIAIQPDDGIAFKVMVKKPGYGMTLAPVTFGRSYSDEFPDVEQVNAYEKLLRDAIYGDQMLFARTDEIEASWRVLSAVLTKWHNTTDIPTYTQGSTGPEQSQSLLANDHREWYLASKYR